MTSPHVSGHARRPLALALVLPSMAGGGAERVALELVNGLPRASYSVTLALLDAEGPLMTEVHPDTRIHEIGGRLGLARTGGVARGLSLLDEQLAPDVYLGFMMETNISLLAWAARAPGRFRRVVVSEHTATWNKTGRFHNQLRRTAWRTAVRLMYPRAHATIAVSSGVAGDLVSKFGVPGERVHVINNPVNLERIAASCRQPPPIAPDPDRFTFVSAGRLVPEKGFDHLLRAFWRHRRTHDSQLILLGDGPMRRHLEDLATGLGIARDVVFVGFTDNPWSVMARSDAFVLASHWEGFGNVLVEAMACGLPIVSTDCPHGPREVLQDGASGILVPPADEGALAAALDRVADDEAERLRLRASSLARYPRFSRDEVLKQYATLFDRMARERTRTP